MSLTAATSSETTKQFTTAGWWVLAIVLVVYVGSTAAGLGWALSASATGVLLGENAPQIPAEAIPPVLYSLAASVGYVFPLLVGTLMVTGEFRHKTLTPTFLATPRRGVVLWAKVLVGVLMGVLFAVIGLLSTVGPAAALLAGFGLDTEFSSVDTWALMGRVVIAFVLWALIGIGVGTLVRNQVAAIVIVLAFTQFVEPIVRLAGSFVPGLAEVTNYLPGAASDALVGSSIYMSMGAQAGGATQLEWWVGGLVLTAYGVVLLVLGHLFSWRRDVT